MHPTLISSETPIWFIDNLVRVQTSGSDTGEALAVVECVGRRGNMPPLHVHRREDELFYCLEGELLLAAGDATVRIRSGQAAFGPRGVPHTYRVESDEARWLTICTPAGFERFVLEVGEPAPEATLPPLGREHDAESLAKTAARYDIEILGPPGALPSS